MPTSVYDCLTQKHIEGHILNQRPVAVLSEFGSFKEMVDLVPKLSYGMLI